MRSILSGCILTVLLLMVVFTPNCQRIKTLPLLEEMVSPLKPLSPDAYPSFSDRGDREVLKQAIKKQIEYFSRQKQPTYYAWGDTTISAVTLRATLEKFIKILENGTENDLDPFIRSHFDVYQSTGERGNHSVTFTGYYIPQLRGSLAMTEEYSYPLYRIPDDLIIKEEKSNGLKKAVRIEKGKEYPYYTRKQIDQEGVLKGNGYEIAYLKDPFDGYTLHVQGSGTILLPDGKRINLHFSGSNYYPYCSLREEMLKDGLLSPENASMESIRNYFSEHPDQLQPYLNRNKRYTFFRTGEGRATGSLGLELTPERSIAIDKQIFPAGALSYIVTTIPVLNPSMKVERYVPWSRFVLNQDEGGAIKGSHRVDIFWGSGARAQAIASHMKQEGRLYYLVAKDRM